MPADNHINKHRLTTAVRTDDSQLLSIEGFKIYGLCHTPFGHAGYTMGNLNRFLHILSYFSLLQIFPCVAGIGRPPRRGDYFDILSLFFNTKSFHEP